MGGFFGVVSKTNCASDVFFGTDYHSHLGTLRGGMAFLAGGRFHRSIHDISNVQFRSRFDQDFKRFLELDPNYGLGVISDSDDQPILVRSHLGTYALVMVGLVTNLEAIIENLLINHRVHFSEVGHEGMTNTLEVLATLINTQDTFEAGIQYAQEKIEGSASILLLSDKGILYAARDRFGRSPVVLGQRDEDSYAVTFETCSLPNLGYEHLRDLGPGEIVAVSLDGVTPLCPPRPENLAICSFLFVYYGYPASAYEGVSVEAARYRNGELLARHNSVEADSVGGIPDSGVGHALGYAAEARIRYARPFVKYTPTWPRSFMPTDQAIRQKIAQMKLLPVPALIKDKRLIFCDDSIVRGTQLRDQVQRLNEFGATETHMRIACPPLLYKCKFLTFSRTKSVMDLITRRLIREIDGENANIEQYRDPDSAAYKALVERIRHRLGMTSLAFQRLDDLRAAIGLGSRICTYCWNGEDISLRGKGNCAGACETCADTCAMKRP